MRKRSVVNPVEGRGKALSFTPALSVFHMCACVHARVCPSECICGFLFAGALGSLGDGYQWEWL